jgi:hypothetical protein
MGDCGQAISNKGKETVVYLRKTSGAHDVQRELFSVNQQSTFLSPTDCAVLGFCTGCCRHACHEQLPALYYTPVGGGFSYKPVTDAMPTVCAG